MAPKLSRAIGRCMNTTVFYDEVEPGDATTAFRRSVEKIKSVRDLSDETREMLRRCKTEWNSRHPEDMHICVQF